MLARYQFVMNTNPQSHPARILCEFLGKFGVPAEGHSREELSEKEREALRRLAAGELGETERLALVPLLAHNEVAMEFLADQTKL